MGVVPPADGFLEFLRAATRDAAALLVFDEVITGFRVARGGAQELYGVEPDLTVLGKVIGGGLPAAAYAGPRETMERIAPAGDVYQAGTLSGNPLATAAGLATLDQLDAAAYERLTALTDRLANGFAELAAEREWDVHRYDAKLVEQQAIGILGDRADGVLRGLRARLGPPWTKDHQIALSATIVAS